jgi:hypothetical protein
MEFIMNLSKNYWQGFAILFIVSSCATQTSLLNDSYDLSLGEKGTHAFWISGIGQTKTVDLSTVCGDGYTAAKTETINSATNILFGILTLGIYTPRDYSVYCSKEDEK